MSTFKNPIGSIDDADIYWKEREIDGSHRAGDIRIDEYKGIDNVSKVKGEGGAVRHNGYFSEDNPVLAQLAVAKTNADKDWLYELAVKWELDRANVEEQRAYDDPRARLARERQAGIDSTLSGGAGAGSAGGASSVMPATQSNLKPSNFYDNANLAINGVSLGFQGLATIIDGAKKVLSFVKGVSTFSDFISQSSSATTLASESATHAQQQTTANNLALDSQRMSNLSQRYMQAGDIATLIPEGLTSDDDWNEHLDTFGIQDESMRKLIRHIAESPEARAKYEEMIHNARQAEAVNFSQTLDLLKSFNQNQMNTAIAQSEIQLKQADFENALTDVRTSTENLSRAKRTLQNEITGDLVQSELDTHRVREAWKSWRKSITAQRTIVDDIDTQIAELKDFDDYEKSETKQARVSALEAQKLYVQTMMDSQASQMALFLQKKYHADYLDKLGRSNNIDTILPKWVSVYDNTSIPWAETQFNFVGSPSSVDNLDRMERIVSNFVDMSSDNKNNISISKTGKK